MPRRYEKVRDRFLRQGKYKSEAMAKKHAAMIENSLRRREGKKPMRPHKET